MKIRLFQHAGTILLSFSILLSTSCSSDNKQSMQAPEIAIMTIATSSSELANSYPATIKGKTDIDIRPQVTGFITKVHVDEGQKVTKGQVLFTLDQVQFNAAVDQAKANVNVAKAAVSTAQLTADNKRSLYQKNIISEYEYQMAENALAQAKAQLAQAEAGLTNANKNLAYTVVTSPSNGVIGSIPNREGSLASPSSAQPLTTVSENSQVYAYFSLNEKDILELTDGGKSTIEQRIKDMPEVKLQLANGSIYPIGGKITTISGVLDNTTGAATVRVLFDNTNGMLRSGSTGTILIPQKMENIILIPQKSTYEIQDLRYVYVVNDSNKVSSRNIKVLPTNDGQNFIVTEGLKDGEKIVIEGVGTTVKDNMTISPKATSNEAKQ